MNSITTKSGSKLRLKVSKFRAMIGFDTRDSRASVGGFKEIQIPIQEKKPVWPMH